MCLWSTVAREACKGKVGQGMVRNATAKQTAVWTVASLKHIGNPVVSTLHNANDC